MKYAFALLLFILLGNASLFATEPITLDSLLHEMVDRAELSKMPDPPYVAKAVSSYDRESKINNPMVSMSKKKDGTGVKAGLPTVISDTTFESRRTRAVRNACFSTTRDREQSSDGGRLQTTTGPFAFISITIRNR